MVKFHRIFNGLIFGVVLVFCWWSFGSYISNSNSNVNILKNTTSSYSVTSDLAYNTTTLIPLVYEDAFTLRPQKQYSLDYKLILSPSDVYMGDNSPDLLIFVASKHANRNFRDAIRNTWGTVAKTQEWPHGRLHIKESVKIVFLFGWHGEQKMEDGLRNEANETGDILQYNYKESYFNLTLKVLTGFSWMSAKCSSARFVLKCDEDTFINIPMLLSRITNLNISNSIFGYVVHKGSAVQREGKFMVTKQAFANSIYPDYTTGNLYVMSGGVAKYIRSIAEYLPYVNMEDVFITGILGHIIKIKHDAVEKRLYNAHKAPDKCDFVLMKKMYGQQVKPDLARTIWRTLNNGTECITS